ncbi:MAG TPA: hypothetical protein VHA30_00455 [Patescibacteria group bacterium]|nr:hypothetical protein [Patescibacteria group bacterium]
MAKNAVSAYRLKPKAWMDCKLACLETLNWLWRYLKLKKTEQFWGVVYDSVSKQPLDPVIVKLLYVDGREIETCVTDLAGRYGFLAGRGKFKIHARKTNYTFPSRYVSGDKDGIYENLYHGEFFVLHSDSEVVAPNIPMDPQDFDWNQQAKQKVTKTHFYTRVLLQRLVVLLFWLGFMVSLFVLWLSFPYPSVRDYLPPAVYLAVMLAAQMTPEARLWGEIAVRTDRALPEFRELLMELHNPKFPQVGFDKARVKDHNRFLLRSEPGDYLLTLSGLDAKQNKTLLASRPVKIGRRGLYNSTLVLRD